MEFFYKQRFFLILFLLFTASCSNRNHSVPGYIEGEYTYISSSITGILFDLNVVRGQLVNKNELLFKLDPQPEKANVEATQANISDLKAQVDLAFVQFKRYRELYQTRAGSKEAFDKTEKDYESKSEQLAGLRALLIQTQWSLQQKTQYAPVSGRVFDTFYRVGETVAANHPVLALLAPENIKVLFYVPERLLSEIKLGQKISFNCDGCEQDTAATVIYISPEAEYTPPVIYSKDTRYKLVYLIRASMPKEIAARFHPGQPIEVNFHHE